MYERLPPNNEQVGYKAPPTQSTQTQQVAPETRSRVSQRSSQGRSHVPPIQRVGAGADQVSARVVRYNDNDDSYENVNARDFGNGDKETIAGHFIADISNFTSNENPRLRNANGVFQIWQPASWMANSKGKDFLLDTKDGVVTVLKGGIYHLYAQVCLKVTNLHFEYTL